MWTEQTNDQNDKHKSITHFGFEYAGVGSFGHFLAVLKRCIAWGAGIQSIGGVWSRSTRLSIMRPDTFVVVVGDGALRSFILYMEGSLVRIEH